MAEKIKMGSNGILEVPDEPIIPFIEGDGTGPDIWKAAQYVVDAAIEVHRTLGGPGLLESVYEEALVYELELRGLNVERQKAVPIVYKGKRLASDLRVDLLVEDRVLVECKATSANNPVFQAQALTYLRLMDLKLALVVNFGMRLVKDGINRVANGL